MHPSLPLLNPSFATLSPFLIPIVAIIMTFAFVMVAVYMDYRKKRDLFALYHQERMAAIDKGVELPPLPEGIFGEGGGTASPRRNLLKGLIWTLAGVFLALGLRSAHEEEAGWFGLIAVGVGVAYLIYYFAVGRKEAELFEAERRAKLAETNRSRAV
jgi:hypothetical protein